MTRTVRVEHLATSRQASVTAEIPSQALPVVTASLTFTTTPTVKVSKSLTSTTTPTVKVSNSLVVA